jgi:hypothetical protein
LLTIGEGQQPNPSDEQSNEGKPPSPPSAP